jgi:hypothetical protein
LLFSGDLPTESRATEPAQFERTAKHASRFANRAMFLQSGRFDNLHGSDLKNSALS